MQGVAQVLPRRRSDRRACQLQPHCALLLSDASSQRKHTVEALQSKTSLASIDTLAVTFAFAKRLDLGRIAPCTGNSHA